MPTQTNPKENSASPSTARRKTPARAAKPKPVGEPRSKAKLAAIRKILVPVDFSSSSRAVLNEAITFARRHEARLILLHVVEPIIYSADLGSFAAPPQTLSIELKNAAAERIKKWREELPEDIIADTRVRVGSPYHQIVTAAAKEKADLILLSTHGYTGWKHVLLGSTAERVVRHAPCSVLVVRA